MVMRNSSYQKAMGRRGKTLEEKHSAACLSVSDRHDEVPSPFYGDEGRTQEQSTKIKERVVKLEAYSHMLHRGILVAGRANR